MDDVVMDDVMKAADVVMDDVVAPDVADQVVINNADLMMVDVPKVFSDKLMDVIREAIDASPNVIILLDISSINEFDERREALWEFDKLMKNMGIRVCVIVYSDYDMNKNMDVYVLNEVVNIMTVEMECISEYKVRKAGGLTALMIAYFIATRSKSSGGKAGIINLSNSCMRGWGGFLDDRCDDYPKNVWECMALRAAFMCEEFDKSMCDSRIWAKDGLNMILGNLKKYACVMVNVRCIYGVEPMSGGFIDVVVGNFNMVNVLDGLMRAIAMMHSVVNLNYSCNAEEVHKFIRLHPRVFGNYGL